MFKRISNGRRSKSRERHPGISSRHVEKLLVCSSFKGEHKERKERLRDMRAKNINIFTRKSANIFYFSLLLYSDSK